MSLTSVWAGEQWLAPAIVAVVAVFMGCSPSPQRAIASPTPIPHLPSTVPIPISTSPLPDPCDTFDLTVIEGAADGSETIHEVLNPSASLGIDPGEYRERWDSAAGESGPVLGPFEPVYISGTTDRQLQARVDEGRSSWATALLAPLDRDDRMESIAIRSSLRERADEQFLAFTRGVLRQVVATSLQGQDETFDCLVRQLLPGDDPAMLVAIDRVAVADAAVEYRVLHVGNVLWLTASRVPGDR